MQRNWKGLFNDAELVEQGERCVLSGLPQKLHEV